MAKSLLLKSVRSAFQRESRWYSYPTSKAIEALEEAVKLGYGIMEDCVTPNNRTVKHWPFSELTHECKRQLKPFESVDSITVVLILLLLQIDSIQLYNIFILSVYQCSLTVHNYAFYALYTKCTCVSGHY